MEPEDNGMTFFKILKKLWILQPVKIWVFERQNKNIPRQTKTDRILCQQINSKGNRREHFGQNEIFSFSDEYILMQKGIKSTRKDWKMDNSNLAA